MEPTVASLEDLLDDLLDGPAPPQAAAVSQPSQGNDEDDTLDYLLSSSQGVTLTMNASLAQQLTRMGGVPHGRQRSLHRLDDILEDPTTSADDDKPVLDALIGDWSADFVLLSDRAGGGASPFQAFQGSLPAYLGVQRAPSTRARRRAPPRRKTDPALQHELAAYARFINVVLGDVQLLADRGTLPLAEDGSTLLEALQDGVLLACLANHIQPGVVDERALDLDEDVDVRENCRLALSAAKAVGVRTGYLSDSLEAVPKNWAALTSILWQMIRVALTQDISVRTHPDLVVLAEVDDHSVESLSQLPPPRVLHLWMRYHVARQGLSVSSLDLPNSIAYTHLLNALAQFLGRDDVVVSPDSITAEESMHLRAKSVLAQAQQLGCSFLISPTDIVSGHPRLNLGFCSALFGITRAIDSAQVAAAATQSLEEITRDEREGGGDVSREEYALRMWMNCLDTSGYVNNLFLDLRDGLDLLRLIDHVAPDTVDWKHRVEANPNHPLKCVANCNYAIELARQLGLVVVNMSGADIASGNHKITLALVWQLMRFHLYRSIPELEGGRVHGRKADKVIISWANEQAARSSRAPETSLRSFKDAHLADAVFLLQVIDGFAPGRVDWSQVSDDAAANARLAISEARKLGAVVFLVAEDITSVRPRLLFSFFAALMAISQ